VIGRGRGGNKPRRVFRDKLRSDRNVHSLLPPPPLLSRVRDKEAAMLRETCLRHESAHTPWSAAVAVASLDDGPWYSDSA
jgi:hypothetical protein